MIYEVNYMLFFFFFNALTLGAMALALGVVNS